MLAQQLYEGIELGEEGAVGLITYMRTDAVRVAAEAQEEAREWVTGRLGREYLPDAPPTYKAKKSAQEAHEAIRPSSVAREPKVVARFLSKDQLALYRLIWERFLASQMLPAVYDTVAADITAAECLFRAQGSTLKFAGFTAVYVESREAVRRDAGGGGGGGDAAADRGRDAQAPRARSQAALHPAAAALHRGLAGQDAGGAGDRAAVDLRPDPRHHPGPRYARREQRHARSRPTSACRSPTCWCPHFPEVMDVEFTAQLEESLDKIEEGDADWVETVEAFYKQFSQATSRRPARRWTTSRSGVDAGQACPDCGKPLLEKWGRFGKFLACSAYPDCKFTKDLSGGRERPADEPTDEICPTCGKPMVIKHGRFGKFIACSGYPECKTTKPVHARDHVPAAGLRRPARGEAHAASAARPSTRARTTPRASSSLWTRPVAEPCPKCGGAVPHRALRPRRQGHAAVLPGGVRLPGRNVAPTVA